MVLLATELKYTILLILLFLIIFFILIFVKTYSLKWGNKTLSPWTINTASYRGIFINKGN